MSEVGRDIVFAESFTVPERVGRGFFRILYIDIKRAIETKTNNGLRKSTRSESAGLKANHIIRFCRAAKKSRESDPISYASSVFCVNFSLPKKKKK